MNFRKMTEFGILENGFRNAQMNVDFDTIVFKLISETKLIGPSDFRHENNQTISKLLKSSQEIIESKNCLQLNFDCVKAVAFDSDLGVDMFGGVHDGWMKAPKVAGKSFIYPLLEVLNSPWKAQLPEWRGRDDPDIKHIRAVTAECSFDILAELTSGDWRKFER